MEVLQSWKKPFFTIYIGQAFSLLSSSAVQFSIIWWITVETSSALALTVASIVGLLPQALIGPFAGVWIDRYNRKKMMMIADAIVALSSVVLGIAFFLGTPSLEFVYVILFVRALGDTFHRPAMQAAIPQIVPKSELTKAGGFGQMIQSLCTMIGPMLGAFLMSVATLQYVMIIDIIGAIIAIILLSTVQLPTHKIATEKLHVLEDMKQGLRAIRQNKPLVRLSIPVLISTIVFAPIGTLLPLIIQGYFEGTAWHNGIVQTLFSIGMLVGAMVVGITGGMRSPFVMISVGIVMFGITSFVAGIIPSSLFIIFCIVIFIMGTTGMLFNIPFTAYIQRTIAEEHLGKVISLLTSMMTIAAPIGLMIAGPFSEMFGPNVWMIVAGIMMIGVGCTCYFLTRKEVVVKKEQSATI